MITREVNMSIWAVGTDDGKSTYEIRRKWGEEGKDVYKRQDFMSSTQ